MNPGPQIHKYFTLWLSLGLVLFLPWPAQAQNLIGYQVVLRTLDKVTAKTKDYEIYIGDSLVYGSLRIDVNHCEKKPPKEIPETYAFLQIYDQGIGSPGAVTEPEKVFSGWMMASRPALSALEHNTYDIWVIDCIIPKTDESLEDTSEVLPQDWFDNRKIYVPDTVLTEDALSGQDPAQP